MSPGVYWKEFKKNELYRNKNWLYQKYIVEKKPSREIATICGADIKTIFYWLRKYEISVRTNSEAQTGPLGNNWKGGISERTWKRVAFEIYGRQCQKCGATKNLDVHHKDRNHFNNTAQNLMVLCRSCHKLLHFQECPETRLKMSISQKGNKNACKRKDEITCQ